MKKLYLLFFALLTAYTMQAQDVITKTDKTEIKALVTEISDETIKYKLFDFQEGPVYNLKRAEIYKIIYSNGREEIFNAPKPTPTKTGSLLGRIAEQPAPQAASSQNLGRTFIGVTYSQHLTFSTDSYEFETKPIFGLNVLLEKYFESKQGGSTETPSKGYGFALTNYFGYSEQIDNDIYTGSRHYATTYLFKEISVKNIVTLGGLAGGGLCYTRGTADDNNEVNPGESAGVFGGGGHLGLFAQRPLIKNAAGQSTSLIRLGYDMFIMSNSNGTLGANLSISF